MTFTMSPIHYSFAIGLIFLSGCEKKGYDNHDLVLLTRYRAKDLCSCIFVMQRDEEYCRNWTKASPNLATIKVDTEQKTVKTAAMQYWSGKAVWINEKEGCRLEED